MPNDATFELLADIQNKDKAAISFITPPTYNIDDMDPRFCMVNLVFTGCYCLRSSKPIDSCRPGMIYIDGKATEPPMIPPLMPMFGQMIGIYARKYLHKYNHSYDICYSGAYDTDGLEIPKFAFTLKTLPRQEPGEKYPEHDAMEDNGFAGMLFNEGALAKYEIPGYYFADGNNGLNMFEPNIGFPVSTTVCASWDEDLSYREGVAIATEAKGMNLHCLLAPALNLQRNPLCGRHTEYFSEDPLLAGRMAGQESRGFESVGVSSCMKHFFGNNAETMRNNNHSLMTERTARELYIRAFEIAFEVNMPDTVMTGYNAANGVYCSNDYGLLRGILREELGFDGFVMTDWNGYGDQGLAGAVDAGISWLAPGSSDDTLVNPIVEALQSGKLSRARLQKNLVDMVKIIIKYKKV